MSAPTQRPVAAKQRGRFITLEGGEGTGKSTQIRRLVARLAANGVETLATREPGGSPRAERLREIILSGGVEQFGPVAETLAFAAARIDHLDHTIRPALEEGCFVLCDRFMDSTRAYQGALGDVDRKIIDQLELVAVGNTRPDLTIILDIDPEAGMKRAEKRRIQEKADRFEAEPMAFHNAVRKVFLDIAKADPDRCAVVDASNDPDAVEADIWALVEERILNPLRLAKTGEAATPAPKLRLIKGSRSKTSVKTGSKTSRSRRPPNGDKT